jgi:hypothetical protein
MLWDVEFFQTINMTNKGIAKIAGLHMYETMPEMITRLKNTLIRM